MSTPGRDSVQVSTSVWRTPSAADARGATPGLRARGARQRRARGWRSGHELAAVDVERGPGDEGRALRREEDHGSAISAGSPSRRTGMASATRRVSSGVRTFNTRSVAVVPGATAFTVMPSAPTSSARWRVKPMTPAFAAA